MATPAHPLTGLRLELTTWRFPVDCEFCGDTIQPGEPGVYAERKANPADAEGEYEENYCWHLDCARAFGDLLLTAAREAEARGMLGPREGARPNKS